MIRPTFSMPALLTAALLLGASCGPEPAALAPDVSMKIEKGKPFPPIVLPSLEDGSPHFLADYRGERILLHIFASW